VKCARVWRGGGRLARSEGPREGDGPKRSGANFPSKRGGALQSGQSGQGVGGREAAGAPSWTGEPVWS
jgi:hypothetical protein